MLQPFLARRKAQAWLAHCILTLAGVCNPVTDSALPQDGGDTPPGSVPKCPREALYGIVTVRRRLMDTRSISLPVILYNGYPQERVRSS